MRPDVPAPRPDNDASGLDDSPGRPSGIREQRPRGRGGGGHDSGPTELDQLSTWAFETGASAALLLDAYLSVLEIGPGFTRLTGHDPDDYLGRDYDFLPGPATDMRALEHLRRGALTGSSTRGILRSYRRDGSSFWNEITVAPVRAARGEVKAVRLLNYDVTERVEARGQLELLSTLLADRQQFTSAVLEGIHTAIITADAGGRVTFINRAACSMLGVEPTRGMDTDLIALLDLPPDVFESLTEADRVKRLSYTFRRPSGQAIEIGLSMSRAFGHAHHDLGYFVVFRDLSDSMQFEIDVRRMERLAAMGTMVAGFAHEIRNPVATLRILTEAMMVDSRDDDPDREYLTRMMCQIERIERLVKTSLQFGRPVAPRRANRAAAAIVSAALEAVSPRVKDGLGDGLQTEIQVGLPAVYADDAPITQILVILLENAIDAAGRSDRVTLKVAAEPREVRFEVKDLGPGIPEWLMNRIFDPFFTTKSTGTGLGLSIAQQLAHENRSRIEVASVEGRGTTFCLLVPRADLKESGPPSAPRRPGRS